MKTKSKKLILGVIASVAVGIFNSSAWAATAIPEAKSGLVYNGTVQAGFVSTAGASLVEGSLEGTTAGEYSATFSPGLETWSDGSTENKTIKFTIARAPLQITARNRQKPYGQPLAFMGREYLITEGSLFGDDKITAVTLASDGASAKSAYTAEGYSILVSNAQGSGLDNYDITYVDGKLTIEKRALTITANNATKTYGDVLTFAGSEFAVSSGSLASGDSISSVSLSSEGAAANAACAADGYAIVASNAQGTGLGSYDITYVDGTLTIAKRALTITADDARKTYGDVVAFKGTEFSITSGTLATGDSVGAVTLASDGAAANAAYVADGYPITAANAQGTGLDNYTISYVAGKLVVDKRALTITANDASKTYGNAVAFAGTEFKISAGTLFAGDTVDKVTLASDGAAAGAEYKSEGYPITASSAQGVGLANYEIAYVDGTLAIARQAITIAATDKRKVYGETVSFAGTEFQVTAGTLVAGDKVDSVTLASNGAAANAAYVQDGYPISVSNAQGTGLNNYAISYEQGTLYVSKCPITITADDASKTYGEEVVFAGTEFKITAGALAAGDTVDSVTLVSDGAVSNAVCRAEGYPITASEAQGKGLDNYDISYAEGLFDVEKRPISITAKDAAKSFGQLVTFEGTEFSITSGTLVLADKIDSVSLASEGAAASAAYKPEPYPITVADAQGVGLDNYEITYVDGKLTIGAYVATLDGIGYATVGEAIAALEGDRSFSDIVITDGEAACPEGCVISGGKLCGVIGVEQAEQRGSLSYNGQAQRPDLTTTATTYRGVPPVFHYAKDKDGDYSTDVPEYKDAGTYELWYYVSADNHVSTTPTNLTVTINRIALTLTADNQTCTMGHPLPALTFSGEGFVAGEDASVLGFVPALACSGYDSDLRFTESSKTYDIAISGKAEDGNYDINYVGGKLNVLTDPVYANMVREFGEGVEVTYDAAEDVVTVKLVKAPKVPIEIADNLGKIAIDLNGYKLEGENGAGGAEGQVGADGSAPIVVKKGTGTGKGVTQLMLVDTAAKSGQNVVSGGNGGQAGVSASGGAGAPAVRITTGAAVAVTVYSGVKLEGGVGGSGVDDSGRSIGHNGRNALAVEGENCVVNVQGGTIGETIQDAADVPSLAYDENVNRPIPGVSLKVSSIYQAWLRSGEATGSAITGSVVFKLGKPNVRTGIVKVSAQVTDSATKKSTTLKGEGTVAENGTLLVELCKGKKKGDGSNKWGEVQFQGESVVGRLKSSMESVSASMVEGGLFAEKKSSPSKVALYESKYKGSWTASFDVQELGNECTYLVAIKVAGNGNASVTVYNGSGVKFSCKSKVLIGKEGWAAIPIVISKKIAGKNETRAFNLWICQDGTITVTGVELVRCSSGMVSMTKDEFNAVKENVRAYTEEGAEVTVQKLKLSYAKSSGVVTGSLKVEIGKNAKGKPILKSMKVVGVAVGGVICGFAYNGNLPVLWMTNGTDL